MKVRDIAMILSLFFLIGASYGGRVYAESGSKESIDELVEEAANVQSDLTEGEYTGNEVKELMGPYFTSSFVEKFMAESMIVEKGQYQILGTDFPAHFIPPFENGTEMEECNDENRDRKCLYGYFPAFNDGPVGYEAHYESVIAVMENGKWKIDGVNYEYVPENQKGQTMGAVADPASGDKEESMPASFMRDTKQSSVFGPLFAIITQAAVFGQ